MTNNTIINVNANNLANNDHMIVTHNGIFHADEMLAISLFVIEKGWTDVNVIRTRNPQVIEFADIVFDVGGVDKIEGPILHLDHHTPETLSSFENGIKKATCAKVAELLYGHNPEFLERLKKEIVYAVSAQDNGQKWQDFDIIDNPLSFVHHMNPSLNESGKIDILFKSSLEMTLEIVQNILARIKDSMEAEALVDKLIAMETIEDQGYLVFENGGLPWKSKVIDFNNKTGNIDFVVFQSINKDSWMVQCVPPEANSFDKRVPLPEEWGGLKGRDLAEVSGFEDAVFCHPGRFLAGFKSKESAIQAVEKLLSDRN